MNELTQQRWDMLLLRGWIKDYKLGWVVHEFLGTNKNTSIETRDLIKRLGIKRLYLGAL